MLPVCFSCPAHMLVKRSIWRHSEGTMPVNFNLEDLIPKELLNKVYDDALSGSAKQVGKLSEDTLKTARLLLAPLQVGAALQERFESMMERISRRVPEERRIEPPAEIVGPTL